MTLLAIVWTAGLASAPLLAPAPAPEADERAQAFAFADKAESMRDAGDLDGARRALERAYELDADPNFQFGLGKLAVEAGDCDDAVVHFRAFVDAAPGSASVGEARAEIARCGGAVEADSDDAEAATPDPEPPARARPPKEAAADRPQRRSPTSPPSRWHRDVAGGVLLGLGAATLGASAGLYGAAFVVRRDAPDVPTSDAFRAAVERSHALRRGAITLAVVGGAALIAAVVRYAVVGRRPRRGAALGVRRGRASWRVLAHP